jgi:acetyltransferase
LDIEDIHGSVQEAIAAVALGSDVRHIRPDRPLREQIDLDSMDWLNVVAALEERFGVAIPASDYGRLATLDAIVDYLATRPRAAPGERRAAPPVAGALPPPTRREIDGATVTVRPIRRDDMSREADFVRNLSEEDRYRRFMVTFRELPAAKLEYLTDVDQAGHVALVATVLRDGQEAIVGAVRYIVDAAGNGCEFAVAVADAWQRTGLAGILMHTLMDIARGRGLATMESTVLAANTRMLKFARQLGFEELRIPESRDVVRVVRSLERSGPDHRT